MKLEDIDQLEKELTWLFVHISWDDPAARLHEIQRTIEYLKELRACAKGELSARQVRQLGVNCLLCGKGLPLATTCKRRFCGELCKKRYQRKRWAEKAGPSQTSKMALASSLKNVG